MFKANVTHTETNSIYDMLEEHNGGDILNNMEVGFSSTRSHLVRFHCGLRNRKKTAPAPSQGQGNDRHLDLFGGTLPSPGHGTLLVAFPGPGQLSFPHFVTFTITNRKIRMSKPHNL